MRGEHVLHSHLMDSQEGSSPHARGTPWCFHEKLILFGIIPACAGNTTGWNNAREHDWDHPRMRGEHVREIVCDTPEKGSSPHARGTQTICRQINTSIGIIPACAGNTFYDIQRESKTRDHPRMRGEHQEVARKTRLGQGSSPHARGTRFAANTLRQRAGIIPACAGNTSHDYSANAD